MNNEEQNNLDRLGRNIALGRYLLRKMERCRFKLLNPAYWKMSIQLEKLLKDNHQIICQKNKS